MEARRGPQPPAVLPPAVQVFLLGGFKVVVRGQVLPETAWRRRAARQLLKILLSRPNRRMSRDEVVELLWPESDPDAASSNFRSTMFALRHAIEPSLKPNGVAVVFSDRDTVWLRPDVELWVDADAFELTVEQAHRAADPLPLLEQASSLYAGPYLPDDVYEDWAAERRDALRQHWADLQVRLAQELERRGDPDAAIRHLQGLMQNDPSDERAAQELMRFLAGHDRRAEALRVYQRLVQALKDELDVEPAESTDDLYRHISASERDITPALTGAAFRCAYPFPSPTELVGREREFDVLARVLAGGRHTGKAALLGAPAGTGKSALLGKLVQLAQSQGVLCLAGGCYEERGAVPLGPFHDALVDFLLAQPAERLQADLGGSVDDLAQLIPELRYHLKLSDAGSSGTPALDRMRAFGAVHAVLRSLAERGPLVVALEDLHAADEATLQLFHYLARQTRRLPVVLLASYRSDEAPADQPLAQTIAAMLRERLVQHVRLNSLGRDETDRLLSVLLAGSPSAALGDSLYATTGGNPLFVEQLVLALSETGQLQQKAGVWHGTTDLRSAPQIVREVIAQRLARLEPTCRDTLAMAAVIGQSFEHKILLAAVEPVTEAVLLRNLDMAIGAQVLQETSAGYAFRHGLLREAVYWGLSAPRRMLLHARAGDLLERFRGERAVDYAAELAHHFALAGESSALRSKALHYSLAAGQRAAALSSFPEALGHFERASNIVEADSQLASLDIRIEALSGRGVAQSNIARYPDSVASFRQLLALSNDPIQRGRARKIVAFSLAHTGTTREVIAECQAGMAEVADLTGPDATEIRATLQQVIGWTLVRKGRFAEVLRVGRAIEQEAANAESGPRMLAHRVIGWGLRGLGQVEEAIRHFELSIDEANLWRNKVSIALSYENLAHQEYLGGRFAAAREHLARALALYRASASEQSGVFSLHVLCRVWVAEGEHVRASEQIVQALAVETDADEPFQGDAYDILGLIHSIRAEWPEAAACFEQARAHCARVDDVLTRLGATVALGFVEQCVGRWDQAAARYAEALEIAQDIDPSPERVLALRHLGRLRRLTGDLEGAATDIEAALTLAQTMPETLEYSPALQAAAELRLDQGRVPEAVALAEQSLEHARTLDQQIEAQVVFARVLLADGDAVRAHAHATEAVALAGRRESPRLLSLAHLALALSVAESDPGLATPHFQTAVRHAEDAQTPYERSLALGAYAAFLRQTDLQPDVANAAAAQAITSGVVEG